MMRTGKPHAGRVNLTKYVKVVGHASETCDSALWPARAMGGFVQTMS
jgi:hypothetical protein